MSHLDELLSVYLDGETTSAESTRVESHLADCHRCRRRLLELNEARAAVRSLPTLELPGTLVPSERAPVRRRGMWMGAAAAIAAGIIAVATILTPAPEPLNLSEVTRQIGARASLDPGAAPIKVVAPAGGWE